MKHWGFLIFALLYSSAMGNAVDIKKEMGIEDGVLLRAYDLMCTAKAMSDIYEENASFTSKYVHATSRGHEAVQLALGLQLKPEDWVSPYYRDDSILLGIGMRPYDLMLQLMAKRDDPFSGGRIYYSHPSLRDDDKPKIIHQSSATGMQAIPTTGIAMGMQYKEKRGLQEDGIAPVVVCSIGDAAMTEGEVAEALQMAALKQMPILYFVQDNEWDISATAEETRAQDAAEYAAGFHGIEVRRIEGNDFIGCYKEIKDILNIMRVERRPFLLHAKVPLLGHHTSGVRREWYRDDLEEAAKRDPLPLFKEQLKEIGVPGHELTVLEHRARKKVEADYLEAQNADDPRPEDLYVHTMAPTPITEEKGERAPKGKEKTVMVDSALFAIRELMTKHPEALLYGQDVGGRLGGVFREAATLAQQFGDDRVFNTPIQEAFIIGSTSGMSAVGLKPIVEVQFADYIWPGLNQLFSELSRSYYLTNGKWPVEAVIRVPIGAYGSGGPYHSSSVESVLTNIRGIKIAYPSTGADLKGLMKAAFYDPNPVIMLEHKGLYWSKIKGTEGAKTIEPDESYIIPFGKGRTVLEADDEKVDKGESIALITYGMGVYMCTKAAKKFPGQVEIFDLRTLVPLDEDGIDAIVRKHSKCIVVTEEPVVNSFAQSISGGIQERNFEFLDAPVRVVGSENIPAIPLNSTLESTMITDSARVGVMIEEMLEY
jgi:2-oxoisovalerate dehydrogenase E1 component